MVFWKSDLVMWPCSMSKDGAPQKRPLESVADFLDDDIVGILMSGRKFAFRCPGTDRGPSFPLVPSLDGYDGHLYETPGFRSFISSLLAEGTLAFTVSGGLGFVHPYELMRKYEAP